MKKCCVLLADGFEEVEALTPVDYLRRAGVAVVVAGLESNADAAFALGAHGIRVAVDKPLASLAGERFDMIVLPGGPGAKRLAESAAVLELARRTDEAKGFVAAICAAPALVLGEAAGMLKGKRFTCYPGMDHHVQGGIHTGADVEEDGRIVTGKGPGKAGAFAIRLVAKLAGDAAAAELAKATLTA